MPRKNGLFEQPITHVQSVLGAGVKGSRLEFLTQGPVLCENTIKVDKVMRLVFQKIDLGALVFG